MLLQIDAAEAGDELARRSASERGRVGASAMASSKCFWAIWMSARRRSVSGIGCFAFVGAIEFGERFVVILLLDEQMDEAGAGGVVVRLEREIFAVGVGGFGLSLPRRASARDQRGDERVRLGVEHARNLDSASAGRLSLR